MGRYLRHHSYGGTHHPGRLVHEADSTTRKFTCGTHVCSPERRFWLLLSTNLGSRSVVRRLLWLCVVCCGVFVLRPIKRTTSSSSSTSNITLNLNRKPTVTPHTQPHPHSSPLRPTSLPTFPRISPSQPQTSLSPYPRYSSAPTR